MSNQISKSPEYKAWKSMHYRCKNTKRHNYHRYGGRGISICERWNDFSAFVADMGKRPVGCSLDRIDNDGDYTPQNCRWVDAKTQAQNRDKNLVGAHLANLHNGTSRRTDHSGRRFNRLTMLSYIRSDEKQSYWLARCDCGNECEVKARSVVRGHKQSCGCLLREIRESLKGVGVAPGKRWGSD